MKTKLTSIRGIQLFLFLFTVTLIITPFVSADIETINVDEPYLVKPYVEVTGDDNGRYVSASGNSIDTEFVHKGVIFSGIVFDKIQLRP